jgi:hypothetical protein
LSWPPGEVVVQHLSQFAIVGESDICKSLVEAVNRAAIHFVVLPVAAVDLDDRGLFIIWIVGYSETVGGTTKGLWAPGAL